MAPPQSNGGDQAPQFLAYVKDKESYDTVSEVVDDMLLPYAEVRRGTTEDAAKAVDRRGAPRVLLVDVDDSEVPLSDIDSLLEVCEPAVRVIVVGQSASLGLFRELMRLGVTDYITKPLTKDLVERAVVVARTGEDPERGRGRTGRVIGVMGVRGGVGASTIAANVGWTLASIQRRRVVLVDMDMHTGALGTMFNVRTGHALRNALEAPDQISQEQLERSVTRVADRLYLLDSEEPIGEAVAYDAEGVDSLIDTLSQLFHFVVVDVPHSPDPVHQHVLQSAQVRVVVAEPTVLAARDAMRQLGNISRDTAGYRTYLVLNRRWPDSASDVKPDAFRKTADKAVDFEIPYGKASVAAALNAGEPVAHRAGPVGRALIELAGELAGRGRTPRSGLLGRLRRFLPGR
jgi:pilus assembly protein CpaE